MQTQRETFVSRQLQMPTSLRGFNPRRPSPSIRCQAGSSAATQPVIKICGVTSAADADLAARSGASLVGLIAWPNAKRSVAVATARAIADAARSNGAEPVAVFVDENAEQMAVFCDAAGIRIAQLHGDAPRRALGRLPEELDAIYVLHATAAGVIQTPHPAQLAQEQGQAVRSPAWVLVDGLKGGSGEALDWAALTKPEGWAARGWLLAGGLHPGNVAQAVATAAPGGVDVSSGVCGEDMLAKDPERVAAFIDTARAAFKTLH